MKQRGQELDDPWRRQRRRGQETSHRGRGVPVRICGREDGASDRRETEEEPTARPQASASVAREPEPMPRREDPYDLTMAQIVKHKTTQIEANLN